MVPSTLPEFAQARVLIVDDVDVNRKLFQAMLESMGVGHIFLAADGIEGLDMLEKVRPNLVILDLMMPRMDGFGFLEQLGCADDQARPAVLVTTAVSEHDSILRAFESGAADYLIKPVDRLEFLARISVHLRSQMMLDELNRYRLRLRRDLEAAERMQQAVLPSAEKVAELESRYGVVVSAATRFSDELGGDIWDVIAIDDQHFALYLADFTGHGVAAAINTFRLHVMMMRKLGRNLSPEAVLSRINQRLLATLQRGQFATMAHAVFDLAQSRVSVAVAGAPPPVVIAPHGGTESTNGQSLPLGVLPQARYVRHELPFSPGCGLMLHSDGLSEALSPTDALLGEEGARRLAAAKGGLEAAVSTLANEGWRFEDDVSAVRIVRR